MSKDRKASREELRQQLDEELSSHSPFALITLAEWQRRERRHRMPLGIGVILLMGVFFIPSLFLIGLITDENWRVAAAFPLMFAAIGAWMWSLSLLSRRFGLCCPYCHTAFAFNHNRSKFERIRPYDDLGRCPRCQRMIFTDWTKEEGWAETGPAAIQRKRSTPQWYSLNVVCFWYHRILRGIHLLAPIYSACHLQVGSRRPRSLSENPLTRPVYSGV